MTRLILTTSDSAAGCLLQAGIADVVIPFGFRFVWGPLPSDANLETSLAMRSTEHGSARPHWLDNFDRRYGQIRRQGLGLIELCQQCETVELWIGPEPNAQLILIQLLDYFRSYGKVAPTLALFQADVDIGNKPPEMLPEWRPPAVKIEKDHLDAASTAWQAYRQPTPRDWFDLLGKDLSILPQFRQSVLELLEELPMGATALGATEMQMLELISAGDARPFDVFPGETKRNQRRVFGYWETGSLLDGLAHCPAPAVSGLDGGPFTPEMHNDRSRFERYKGSELKLTALDKAILARTEDQPAQPDPSLVGRHRIGQ